MSIKEVNFSNYKKDFSFKNKAYRALWNFSYLLLFRPFALPIFNKWRIFLLKLFGANIHFSSLIYASVKIWAPYNLVMEEYSCLGKHVDCYNQGKVIIRSNSVISQKTYLCASSHDITDSSHPLIIKPIIIEDQAWIAADVFIGPGVTIGQGAVIGARSAVFKNVDPWTVVGGNPAQFIKVRRLIK